MIKIIVFTLCLGSMSALACNLKNLNHFNKVMDMNSGEFDFKNRKSVLKVCKKVLPSVKCYRRVAEKYLQEIDVTIFEMNKHLCIQMIKIDETMKSIK